MRTLREICEKPPRKVLDKPIEEDVFSDGKVIIGHIDTIDHDAMIAEIKEGFHREIKGRVSKEKEVISKMESDMWREGYNYAIQTAHEAIDDME